jgi:hypothetical protein
MQTAQIFYWYFSQAGMSTIVVTAQGGAVPIKESTQEVEKLVNQSLDMKGATDESN